MERIYDDAKDKNVAAVIVYAKEVSSTCYAYKDAAKTEAFTSVELKDAYIKGCVVRLDDEDGNYAGLASPVMYLEPNSDIPAAGIYIISGASMKGIYATDPEIA